MFRRVAEGCARTAAGPNRLHHIEGRVTIAARRIVVASRLRRDALQIAVPIIMNAGPVTEGSSGGCRVAPQQSGNC